MTRTTKKTLIFSISILLIFTAVFSANAEEVIPIKEIQSNTKDGDASAYAGETVTSEGIVTAVGDNGFYMQGGKEPWSGIWVYVTAEVAPGDKVRVTGKIDEYYQLTEFNQPEKVEVIGSADIPEPIKLKTSEVSQEKYEGVLVRIENLEVTNPTAGHGEWLVTDGSGETKIAGSNVGASATPAKEGQQVDYIEGLVTFDYGEYKIEPKDISGLKVSFPDKGKIGEEATHPEDLDKIEEDYDHILTGDVVVNTNDTGVTLSFTTSKKVTELKVEYGVSKNKKMQRLNFSEETTKNLDNGKTEHEITLNLDKLNIDNDNLINYRIHADKIPYGEKFKVKKENNSYKLLPYISEGPFVDQVKENSAIISWETNVPTKGEVKVGNLSFWEDQATKNHEIKVQGLNPETNYNYKIINTVDKSSYKWEFQSSFKSESNDNQFSFAFMGDGRAEDAEAGLEIYADSFNYDTTTNLLIDSYKRNSDFVIFGGDLIDGYTNKADDYRFQLESWKNATELVGSSLPIYEIMGNHEAVYTAFDDGSTYGLQFDKKGENSAEAIFADEFVNPINGPDKEHESAPSYDENAYYFDYDNARFIVMNTNYWWTSNPEEYGGNLEGFILEKQMNWLKNKITEAEKNSEIDHIIPILHEPSFPNGGHIDDSMWYSGQKEYVLEMRDELIKTLTESEKTNILLGSDEHNYQRLLITEDTPVYANMMSDDYSGHLWQIVSGGAGAPKYDREYGPWGSYLKEFKAKENYVKIDIDGKELSIKAIDNNGNVLDQKTLVKKEQEIEKSYKFATFNIQNLTTEQVQKKGNPQAEAAAEIIQRVNPDVLMINEIDNNIQQGKNISKTNVRAFIENYLKEAQKDNLEGINYKYVYFGKSNTGVHSGFDMDNNGEIDDTPGDGTYGNDAFGYGEYAGQYAMAFLSKYPINTDEIRTLRKFRWKDMPNNKMPEEFYSKPAQSIFRLSSKSHWDIPVELGGETVHVLAAHPTPPVFDGEYNRNGKRNHDEVRLIADYISNKDYIYSDDGEKGGLSKNSKFVVMGDMNANPGEKENYQAADLLLNHERIDSDPLPVGQGGIDVGPGARNNTQENMLLDYVLPSNNLNLLGSAVVRPGVGPNAMKFNETVKKASDHNMVWIEFSF